MIIVEVYPMCDFCDVIYPDYINATITTIKSCRKNMVESKWVKIKGRDKCPDCVMMDEELKEAKGAGSDGIS